MSAADAAAAKAANRPTVEEVTGALSYLAPDGDPATIGRFNVVSGFVSLLGNVRVRRKGSGGLAFDASYRDADGNNVEAALKAIELTDVLAFGTTVVRVTGGRNDSGTYISFDVDVEAQGDPASGPVDLVRQRSVTRGRVTVAMLAAGVADWVGTLVEKIVPAWARAADPPAAGTDLPEYEQEATQGLFSRAGALFWRLVNEVPDTPGTDSAFGHVLTVTGNNDQDYAWRAAPAAVGGADQTARAAAATAQRDVNALAPKVDSNRQTLASLEDDLPDPPIPAAVAEAKRYRLMLPAKGALSERALWEEQAADPSADVAAGLDTVEAAVDAVEARLDAVEGHGAPIFDPSYWLNTADARNVVVHLDPMANSLSLIHI